MNKILMIIGLNCFLIITIVFFPSHSLSECGRVCWREWVCKIPPYGGHTHVCSWEERCRNVCDTNQTQDEKWMIVGVCDFNNDNRAELAWRRINNTGEVRIWKLNKKTTGDVHNNADYAILPPAANGWMVVGAA
ncbi:MAG: hypothetical protein JXA20_09155, partial [Spirochaetes bacterium]|nr:hypothetical protein [Spirochaetota bacterium]